MTRRVVLYSIALAIFLLDRFTKHLIEAHLSVWDSIPVIPRVFYIVHTRNRGAAFGMLADATHPLGSIFLIGVSLVVLVGISIVLWNPARWGFSATLLTLGGLTLVLGGALGNVYDRVLVGSVTDFLQVFIGAYEFPSFNVADSAISVGSAGLLADLWVSHRRQGAARRGAA